MTERELLELIAGGENSGVEFKRDDVAPERVAREMAALLNLEGGCVLLGVDDDRHIRGLARRHETAEEWVMNIARDRIRPAPIPYWEVVKLASGSAVGVISLPADSPDKPYKAKRGSAWVTMVRVGTTTRDATDDEEIRLYQQSGRLQYDIKPVPGAKREDLDHWRLTNYFRAVRKQDCPAEDDAVGWCRLLVNTDLAVEDKGRTIPTVAAMLMFGRRPTRYLPHAAITAVAYRGKEKDYEATERTVIRSPAVALLARDGTIVEAGVVEQAVAFVRRNTRVQVRLADGARREERWDFPEEAIREAVVNAIAHRDYTITVTDIELSIYADRLEIISPGRLPNTVTVDKMRAGYRASRNELVKEILRDYGYVEATGLGVPRKIVRGMREHNGTEPDLIEEESRFIVRLWKEKTRTGTE